MNPNVKAWTDRDFSYRFAVSLSTTIRFYCFNTEWSGGDEIRVNTRGSDNIAPLRKQHNRHRFLAVDFLVVCQQA
jgi:hypothetical protein